MQLTFPPESGASVLFLHVDAQQMRDCLFHGDPNTPPSAGWSSNNMGSFGDTGRVPQFSGNYYVLIHSVLMLAAHCFARWSTREISASFCSCVLTMSRTNLVQCQFKLQFGNRISERKKFYFSAEKVFFDFSDTGGTYYCIPWEGVEKV